MLRPFFILLFSSAGIAFGASSYLLNYTPFIQIGTLLVIVVPLSFLFVWLVLKLLARHTDLTERFGADLMAFSYFTIMLGPFVGAWYHWENTHTLLYIDNGLGEETTFHFENWMSVTVSPRQIYSLTVPIASLSVKYNDKKEMLPIREAGTVVFNPDGLYNYAEYSVIYGNNKISSPFSKVEVLRHPRFVITKADYIFQSPPKQVWGAAAMAYTKRTVFTRMDDYTMKRYEKLGKRPRAQDLLEKDRP